MRKAIMNAVNNYLYGIHDIVNCRRPKDILVWYANDFVEGVEYYDILSLHSKICILNDILNCVDFAFALIPVIAVGGFACYRFVKNRNK